MSYDHDAWEAGMDAITDRVDAAIEKSGEKNVLVYSAYNEVDDVPVDNLDDVVFEGTFVVEVPHDDFWDGRGVGLIGVPVEEQGGGEPCGQDFVSDKVTNPTWLELAVIANKAILTTNDLHHVFLESAEIERPGVIRLWFGS